MTGGRGDGTRRVLVVARREMVTRARTTAFRVTTALMLVAVVAGIAVPAALASGTTTYVVAVTGGAERPSVVAAVRGASSAAGLTVRISQPADRAAAVSAVQQGTAAAAVIGAAEIVWKGIEDRTLGPVLRSALTQVTVAARAARLGIAPAQVPVLLAPVTPRTTRLDAGREGGPLYFVALIGVVLLFTAINFFGSQVLMGVVEEKSNRVVEVLLARLRPSELLAGKVLGIGLLGLAQLATLAAAAGVTLRVTRPPDLPATTGWSIAGVLLWFVLGYAFYSVLYGSLGALASRPEEAQAAVTPLTMLLLAVYFAAFAATASPEAWWVTVLSFLPPSAPIVMPLRAGLVLVPAWQVVLAALLTAGGTWLLIRVGGRLYRGAILRTGGRVHLREAWQASPNE